MDSFIVSIGEKKKEIKLDKGNVFFLDGEKIPLVIQKINNCYYLLKIHNRIIPVSVMTNGNENLRLFTNGSYFDTTVRSKLKEFANSLMGDINARNGMIYLKAPMPGMILKIHRKVGDNIKRGDPLIILEAMKMENEIKSPADGVLKEIFIQKGKSIEKDENILSIE
jgi:biotin carboxyl carrier protein